MRSSLKVGSLVVSINPETGLAPFIIRDGAEVDVVMDDQHPLDVAQALSTNADIVMVSGKITLMAVACALVTSGIALKPNALTAIRRGGDAEPFSSMLESACRDGADKFRMLMQRLTHEPVTFLSAERALEGGAQEFEGVPAFV